ncbi:MAG: hypothetical protein DRJ40_05970 [Thermoprotei archaeon]|nr:MAG: hypothetical protein DRJ40_05970 [Thermoprotei archaeon]
MESNLRCVTLFFSSFSDVRTFIINLLTSVSELPYLCIEKERNYYIVSVLSHPDAVERSLRGCYRYLSGRRVTRSRVIRFPAKVLINAFHRLRRRAGTGADAILYYIGLEYGISLGEYLRKKVSLVLGRIQDVVSLCLKYLSAQGFGSMDITLSDREVIIRFTGANGVLTHFVRGFITGISLQLLGREPTRSHVVMRDVPTIIVSWA